MRVYISGPITGTKDYMRRFQEAEDALLNWGEGVEVINPAAVCFLMPDTFKHRDYMDICFRLLEKCDTIYFMKDWKKSKGACMEYGYALAKDMVIMYEEL